MPTELIVASGQEVIERLALLQKIAGSQQHADLIRACLDRLDLFRLSRQVDALESVLATFTRGADERGAA